MTVTNRAIHHPVYVDTGVGQIGVEVDHARHVEQLMMQVLLVGPGDRICRPDFGCGMRRMVFAPNSDVSASLTKVSVFQALTRWLGTFISVDDVGVTARNEVLEVAIEYTLRATAERRYLNVEVAL
jgi:phage baseplate assembly protein W